MRLKCNEGTHNTLLRSKDGVSWTDPIWVTRTEIPFGNQTVHLMAEEIVKTVEHTIWSVASESKIQGVDADCTLNINAWKQIWHIPVAVRCDSTEVEAIETTFASWLITMNLK